MQKDLLSLKRKLATAEGNDGRIKDLILEEIELAGKLLESVKKQVKLGILPPLEDLKVRRYILSLKRDLAQQ